MTEVAIRQAALPAGHPLIAASLASRAIVAGALGRPAEELADGQRALAMLTAAGDRERPSLAGVHDEVSHAELALDQVDPAVTDAQAALDLREQLLGPDHDRVAASLWRLARALAAQGPVTAPAHGPTWRSRSTTSCQLRTAAASLPRSSRGSRRGVRASTRA